jgi:hypothetical protein
MKLNIDIANLRKKIIDKPEVSDSDKDLQFIAGFLNVYSKMKQKIYGSPFEYTLDVEIEDSHCGDQTDNYKTLEDYKGTNLERFFSCSRIPEESKEESKELINEENNEEVLSSVASSQDYTVSDYDFPQDDLTNSVNKTMTIAIIGINRSIIEKGISVKNNITDQIILVNDNDEIIEKCDGMQRTTNKSPEFIDQTIDLTAEESKEQEYFDQLCVLDKLSNQSVNTDTQENKHIGIPISIPRCVNGVNGANVVIPLLQLEPAEFHTHFSDI